MIDQNSDISAEFLSFIQGLLVPDVNQRLASKDAILGHAFIQQEAQAVAFWENAAQNQFDDSAFQAMDLNNNVYFKELIQLIDLSTDEQIDGVQADDQDDEELTEEQ